MTALTTFKRSALERYLMIYDLGDLHDFKAISSGIEKSNYLISLNDDNPHSQYVLTISENLSFEEVPFFNDLMGRLAKQDIPVPQVQRTLDGMSSAIFCGKPTWLFNRLQGEHPKLINNDHCNTIGQNLAKIHIASADAKYERSNPFCSDWMQRSLQEVSHHIHQEDLILIQHLAEQYSEIENHPQLPKGIIHGGLFTDNVLFEGTKLGGIIDIDHACNDFFVQDIAVTINDWCKTRSGQIDSSMKESLLKGYQSIRNLNKEEEKHLPLFLKFSALRLFLTRLLSGKKDIPFKDFLIVKEELPRTE